MKRTFFRLSILILTFAIGLSFVWILGLLTDLFPPVENKSVSFNAPPAGQPVIPIAETSYQKPRFMGTYRGCGFGYTQGYETDDGQQLSEGISGFETRKKASAEFKKRIAEAIRIVERVPNYKHRLGESGERIVLVNAPNERNDKETVSILWHGGGQFIAFISAPSLELAVEFEQFLEATNYTAHRF